MRRCLELPFKDFLIHLKFPSDLEKGNIVPVKKRNDMINSV